MTRHEYVSCDGCGLMSMDASLDDGRPTGWIITDPEGRDYCPCADKLALDAEFELEEETDLTRMGVSWASSAG